jgi:hypothetical protein
MWRREKGRCDERKGRWRWRLSCWVVVGGDRRDDEEECGGCDGSRKRIGAGGLAYKGENGDPYWMRMKGKIETDLGCEKMTDMRCR